MRAVVGAEIGEAIQRHKRGGIRPVRPRIDVLYQADHRHLLGRGLRNEEKRGSGGHWDAATPREHARERYDCH